jgi:hypothetical protein
MAENQAQDESIMVRATNGAEGRTLTFTTSDVSINPDNTYSTSISLEEGRTLIRKIELAMGIHQIEVADAEERNPLRGQRVDIKVGDEVLRGTYVAIRAGRYLVANMGKTKHDYFDLDKVSFSFPDAPESLEERIFALTDGWVK